MNAEERDVARIKNALVCVWIGLIYGLAASVLTDTRWTVTVLVILLVAVSSYINVGRKWLERVAPLVLFGVLLGLLDLVPTGDALKDMAKNAGLWLKSWVG